MPGGTEARSCFRGLREALCAHLSDESLRKSYEDARAQITEVLDTQPDVPVTQGSLAWPDSYWALSTAIVTFLPTGTG